MLTGGMGIAGVEGVWAGDGGDRIAAVLTAQGGKKGNWGKERAAVTGGIRGKGGNWGKERGAVWVIVGFMLYWGLIWGMWGAQ